MYLGCLRAQGASLDGAIKRTDIFHLTPGKWMWKFLLIQTKGMQSLSYDLALQLSVYQNGNTLLEIYKQKLKQM